MLSRPVGYMETLQPEPFTLPCKRQEQIPALYTHNFSIRSRLGHQWSAMRSTTTRAGSGSWKVVAYIPCPHAGGGQWREAYRDDLIEAALWRLKSTAFGEHVPDAPAGRGSQPSRQSRIFLWAGLQRGERTDERETWHGTMLPFASSRPRAAFFCNRRLAVLGHACISVSRFLNSSPRW
jgi:hypothetical protein